ncbi:MAG: Gfo/Idh/MocA family oxidoreductase [Planctomycetales bacterium]|nr:Gfo/Idh/MocA family oxidoreductase [Planctomycetales bacterium]
MPSTRLNRRTMLKSSALATAGVWVAGGTRAAESKSANEKLNIAVIGIGGRGGANLGGVSGENIVALCDVDDQRAGKAYEKHSKAKKFFDFRQMLDEMEREIDAVVISTPDHTHFHPAIMAMERGKHCYCEKPMAHAVWEVRRMTELAREKKLATQLGVQRHTLSHVHRSVELIKAGAIGEVREVHAWVGGSRGMPSAPDKFPPVPDHLKWDLWQGPVAERKYSPAYAPYNWRFWWDYGTGETGNWGCHILDIAFWALDLRYPTEVETTGPEVDAERTPKSLHAQFKFPQRGKLPPCDLHWYHTGSGPAILAEKNLPRKGNTLFIGSEGMLLCGFGEHMLYPEEKNEEYKSLDSTIPKSPGFHKEWIAACKGGDPATCHFDYSGPLTETVLLGNVSYRVGEKLVWDAEAAKVTNTSAANELIRPVYRKGWEI